MFIFYRNYFKTISFTAVVSELFQNLDMSNSIVVLKKKILNFVHLHDDMLFILPHGTLLETNVDKSIGLQMIDFMTQVILSSDL